MRPNQLLKSCLFLLVPALPFACDSGDGGADTLQGVENLSSSGRPGMGAVVYPGGVTFRVWAPGASRVFVAGDFNGWSDSANELGNEFNGNFSSDVAGAQVHQKYKFVIQTSWGEKLWKSDPRAARVENSSGSSIVYNPTGYQWKNGFGTPSFNDQVIYEMHVGTFHDSPGFGPGNWQSATAKLDYLRDLGVNMLKIMPVAEFPGDFSWGYNPSFPYAPETAYGTPEDMKAFVDAAHGKGIGIILDVVHNHYGPNDLSMWCITGDCLGNGGHYFYNDWRSATPWGNSRPDFGRPEVRDYVKDSALWWLNEYRIDGLRWDATAYIRDDNGSGNDIVDGWNTLRYANDEIDRTQPWKISIAEDLRDDAAITRSTSSGGAGFDSQWDGRFVHPIRKAIIDQGDASRDMGAVANAILAKYNGQASQRVIYTESHDEVANGHARVPEEIWPGNAGSWAAKKRSTLGAALVFTSPGIPMIFQGQEFLEDGFFSDSDPLTWDKLGPFGGIKNLYGDLIKLRRNWFNNTRGLRGENVNVHHVNNGSKVIAFHRWQGGGPGDDVVIVANFSTNQFSNYKVGFPRGGLWRVRFNSDWNGYSSDFGNAAVFDTDANGPAMHGMAQSATVTTLAPYSVVIFSQLERGRPLGESGLHRFLAGAHRRGPRPQSLVCRCPRAAWPVL